jgi:hypothetical protein
MSGGMMTPAQAQYNYNHNHNVQVQHAMQARSMQAARANQQNMYMHMHQRPVLPRVMYGNNKSQVSPTPGGVLYPQQMIMSAGMFGTPQAGLVTMFNGFAPPQQQVGPQPTTPGVMVDHWAGSQANMAGGIFPHYPGNQ